MIATSGMNRRFNLLYLEEGEQYIKEFTADVKYYDIQYNTYKYVLYLPQITS